MFTFKLRGGTAAQWLAVNPVLQSREPGVETDTGKLKIGNGIARWTELGYLSGEGSPGQDGDSAYQVAVDNGFVGSQAAWLLTLKGADGVDGADGTNGTNGSNGTDGTDGVDGSDGASAYEVAVLNGFVGTQSEWLLSLKGSDGVDGTDGSDGADYSGPSITVSATAPSTPAIGDVWIDTSA